MLSPVFIFNDLRDTTRNGSIGFFVSLPFNQRVTKA
jgi:hypothetical protein